MSLIFDDRKLTRAFTIVELLVVIVVVGVLSAITIVSYSGIVNRANEVAIKSELNNASRSFQIYYITNGTYPTSLSPDGCPSAPVVDTINCVEFSSGTTYEYTYKTQTSFDLVATKGSMVYIVTENTTAIAYVDPNWITIGSQAWQKRNMNVGVMISGLVNQTNNGGSNIIEKYCYDNIESNCTALGGYYQWDEAMGYSVIEGSRGICPSGSHLPSDSDWKLLEAYLGMTQPQFDNIGWRGSDQGTRLKQGGVSGFELLLNGYREVDGLFYGNNISSDLWTSSQSGGSAMARDMNSINANIYRGLYTKNNGFSVRCLKNA